MTSSALDGRNIEWTVVDTYKGHLTAHATLLGCNFHLDAIEVKHDGDTQVLAHDNDDPSLDELGDFTGADKPFETIEIKGKTYVVYMTPFCT